ncbi:MAG: hypothetical protein M8860_12210 [marine benthic group bacterium]|mgnify:CR=1 FL=1|jgi:hypothetical protein|nr:hypothetical protein [Gemmatimonadota bacterium]MCL7963598.1 hypothetical protein [Candidatus Carthagonibacter metallireducens]MCL7937674.1 hypothetical protein [Gemmatimonadota bacterium]MCL7957692.1 hypothetical protein [Gemmatimonadota bacterium]MCL7964910.1 hypothetical protein [Gemmatimonadota bacterium]
MNPRRSGRTRFVLAIFAALSIGLSALSAGCYGSGVTTGVYVGGGYGGYGGYGPYGPRGGYRGPYGYPYPGGYPMYGGGVVITGRP